jgi:NADH-quinone oxidoreductase subunit C
MDSATITASLQESVPDGRFESVASVDGQPTILVTLDRLPATARALRDRSDLSFDCLIELTAIDFWPREPRFEVMYILLSIAHRHRLRMKVRLSGDAARLASVTSVWPAANWLEREVWDLFGIVFEGHPDLRRLLMPEDWEGHPLRKDYPVQIRMSPRTAEPLQVSEQEFRRNMEADRLARRE